MMHKKLSFLLLPLLIAMLIAPAQAQTTNVSALYGYNGTTFIPIRTTASGTLMTDINISESIGISPSDNNTYDLGDVAKIWANLYVRTIRSLGPALSFVAGGSERLTITAGGLVGIGITAPQQTLEVVGTGNFTGRIFLNGSTWIRGIAYTWPSADGSSGQFLQTSGAGVLSWAAVSGTNLSGGGATNRLVKWLNTTHLTNSIVTDDGTNLGIGTTSPTQKLDVVGNVNVTGALIVNDSTYGSTNVSIFTSNGTWTKLPGAKSVYIILIGGGAGAGSGRRGAAGTLRYGGVGGGGGGWSQITLPASILSATETVTVGTGGSGGAAVTVDDTNGNNGSSGGNSSFGSWIIAYGGDRGGGGTASSMSGGGGGTGIISGASGTNPQNSGQNGGDAYLAGAGGGNGGRINSDNSYGDCTAGGSSTTSTTLSGGAKGASGGGAGGNGTSSATNRPNGGAGGGGGCSNTGGVGGTGGNGGNYGGGAGSGGASANGSNSGAGGSGAAGIVIVITYF